ncbi:MAG: hypothetical protein JWM44_3786 [Bacilli bacterium]|nr:hypothetical protein [Bacilli bacterium]
MPFSIKLSDEVKNYIYGHLPEKQWYDEKYYPFIKDTKLRDRLIIEFKNGRIIYKLFEGLQASDELLLAQIKTQVIMYVSIQEAVISHILFELYKESEIVLSLLFQDRPVEISIPKNKVKKLQELLSHDGKIVIPYYIKKKKVDKTKIRYDQKVNACYELNLIKENLRDDLIRLYEYRNTIHLEAEMKKNLEYDLVMGELAYKRVIGLSIELSETLNIVK